jgi:hypothetical protein
MGKGVNEICERDGMAWWMVDHHAPLLSSSSLSPALDSPRRRATDTTDRQEKAIKLLACFIACAKHFHNTTRTCIKGATSVFAPSPLPNHSYFLLEASSTPLLHLSLPLSLSLLFFDFPPLFYAFST